MGGIAAQISWSRGNERGGIGAGSTVGAEEELVGGVGVGGVGFGGGGTGWVEVGNMAFSFSLFKSWSSRSRSWSWIWRNCCWFDHDERS